MRTSARGGAGKRFPKYEANVSQTRRSEAGERRSTTAERCPCPPPQRPTGLGGGGLAGPQHSGGSAALPGIPVFPGWHGGRSEELQEVHLLLGTL